MNGLVAWWDAPAGGPENMAADELLAAESLHCNRVVVRIYGWREPSVSLGGFQRLADAHACPEIAPLPLVRRPSGGGGIIHGTDLTYAAAVPRDHAWGGDPQRLYDVFHEALAELLRERGVAARRHPGRGRESGDEARFLCFDRRARGDLVIDVADTADGHKILGSAQRRLHAAVLQHGSLLLERPTAGGEAIRHPGLHDLHAASRLGPLRDLVGAWLERVAHQAQGDVEWREESFAASAGPSLAAAADRFRSQAWLARR
jgi:lipoate-protein ligase A